MALTAQAELPVILHILANLDIAECLELAALHSLAVKAHLENPERLGLPAIAANLEALGFLRTLDIPAILVFLHILEPLLIQASQELAEPLALRAILATPAFPLIPAYLALAELEQA